MTGEAANTKAAVLEVGALPDISLDASRIFYAEYLEDAYAMLEGEQLDLLVVQMPPAGTDHDDWRRSLARDLARKYAPARVNVIGASEEAAPELINYLLQAPGVTGQYCPSVERPHD